MGKGKGLIGSILVILITVFVVNWYYAEVITGLIKYNIEGYAEKELVTIHYGKIFVNPLMREVIMHDIVICDDEKYSLHLDEIECNITWNDLAQLINEQIISEFHDLNIEGRNIILEDLEGNDLDINMSLESFKIDGDFEIDKYNNFTEKYKLVKGISKVEMVGFKAEFPSFLEKEIENSFLGKINTHFMEQISIDDFTIDFKYNEDEIIATSKLNSPLLSAKIDLELYDLVDPFIKEAKLEVLNMSEEVKTVVRILEYLMGQRLPRQNDNIVIEASGRLGELEIKDIKF